MSPHQTPQILKRILITLSLGLAFIVMASIFSPDRSRASDDTLGPRRPSHSRATPHGAGAPSADAHHGLNSLGTIESGQYSIAIYATDAGPRYTITQRDSGAEIGTLLTPEQVQLLLPAIDLKALDFTAVDGEQKLMLAEPRQH